MKKLFVAVLCFILPTVILRKIVVLWGWSMAPGSRIGFSFVWAKVLCMRQGCRIGHFNFVRIESLDMQPTAYIGHLNYINGPLSLTMDENAGVGNQNRIFRGALVIRRKISQVKLGRYAKITARHSVECLADIVIGNYSTIAGSNTQIWTHGYYHYPVGLDRFRIDGGVNIGNNVYVGASCVISMGVTICDAVSIGSHSSVAKSIVEPGLYVSQPLRHIAMTPESVMSRLDALPDGMSIERAYEKK